jgi:UDP-N-acetylglucosamine acyltransferase
VIHPTAVIDSSAQVHETCEVGPYAIIGPEVTIGRGTRIGPHTVISGPTVIGEDNRIFQFASIGEDPQDLKYDGEESRLEIGDRNTIREFVTINRGTTGGGGETRLGDDNLLMAYVHVAHDCIIGSNTIFANAASLAGHVTVGDYAILGGFSLVHQFSRVGDHSFSGMGSVINKDIPPFLLVSGHYVEAKGVNKQGLKRRGFSPEAISAIHKTYMKMVKKKGVKDESLAEIEKLAEEHESVAQLLEFLRNSERGNVS